MKTAIAVVASALITAATAYGGTGPVKPHTCSGPAEWVAEGRGGTVTLAFVITPGGTVTDVRVLNSSGYPDMDAQAVACAQGWEYHPSIRNGVAVATPWRTEVMLGDFQVALSAKRALNSLNNDIHRCVMAAALVDPAPDAYEITDIRFRFPLQGVPSATVEFSTASEALTRKVENCARQSPALAGAGKPGSTAAVSFNWSGIARFEKAKLH